MDDAFWNASGFELQKKWHVISHYKEHCKEDPSPWTCHCVQCFAAVLCSVLYVVLIIIVYDDGVLIVDIAP